MMKGNTKETDSLFEEAFVKYPFNSESFSSAASDDSFSSSFTPSNGMLFFLDQSYGILRFSLISNMLSSMNFFALSSFPSRPSILFSTYILLYR